MRPSSRITCERDSAGVGKYAADVSTPLGRRLIVFVYAFAIAAIVCIAVVNLPDSYLAQLLRSRSLSSSQAGWAYRLLAFAAVAQAAWGGFVVLKVERLKKARAADPKLRSMERGAVVSSISKNAAAMIMLTLTYGLASIWVTGQRAGFWLFPVLALAQGAWYYRQIGQLYEWLTFQPVPLETARRSVWRREPPDYCPPIARGLVTERSPRDTSLER